MIKKNLLKATALILTASMAISLAACGKKNNDTPATEETTRTDIMAVEITDKDGNRHKLEGIGVTGEDGKTIITVTDKNGNKTVIVGEAATDADGKNTVTNATVTEGGSLVSKDGATIDTAGATVGEVKDNNDGSTATDVVVDSDTVMDVINKQEQASKEDESKEQASKEEVSKDLAGEKETSASGEKETEAVTLPPIVTPTQSQTEAATQKPVTPTQSATTAPTTAPTQPPTQAVQTPEQEFIANSTYREYDTYIYVLDYKGTQENLVVPSYINGKPVTQVHIRDNSILKSITYADEVEECSVYNCTKLEIVNFPKTMEKIGYWTIGMCSNIKYINISAVNVILDYGWATTNTIYVPYFSNATLNFATSADKVKIRTTSYREEYHTLSDDLSNVLDYVNKDCGGGPIVETTMFSKVNFNVK